MSDWQVDRIYGWKDLWKRCVLGLEWKRVGMRDCEVVMMEQVSIGEWN